MTTNDDMIARLTKSRQDEINKAVVKLEMANTVI